jgi:excisionase family DNA binding protein
MLSVKQAAEQLGISVALVYSLCAARRLRHERYGLGRGTIRIPTEAIEEYRRNCTKVPNEPARPQIRRRFRHVKL